LSICDAALASLSAQALSARIVSLRVIAAQPHLLKTADGGTGESTFNVIMT
jgi:hypothetical protein